MYCGGSGRPPTLPPLSLQYARSEVQYGTARHGGHPSQPESLPSPARVHQSQPESGESTPESTPESAGVGRHCSGRDQPQWSMNARERTLNRVERPPRTQRCCHLWAPPGTGNATSSHHTALRSPAAPRPTPPQSTRGQRGGAKTRLAVVTRTYSSESWRRPSASR